MLVSELNVTEFRGIRKCEKPLELSKFTVLIGRNNVGKSAILEALYLLPHPRRSDRIFGISKLDVVRDKLHSGAHLAYGYSGTAELRYAVNSKRFCITIDDHSEVKLYVNDTDITNISDKDLEELLRIKLENLADVSVLIPNNLGFLKLVDNLIKIDEFKNRIMKLGYHVKVAKIVSECVDDEFTEIYLDTMKIRKELPDGNVFYIHVDDIGD